MVTMLKMFNETGRHELERVIWHWNNKMLTTLWQLKVSFARYNYSRFLFSWYFLSSSSSCRRPASMKQIKQGLKLTSFYHKDHIFPAYSHYFVLVRGDERVIRGCGYEEDPKGRDCYTTVLEEYNTEVCMCNEDGCNSATGWASN